MGACGKYRDQISAYLDGALTGEERRALLSHLDVCGDCRAYLADQAAIRAALAELETPAPEGFAARVMERIQAEEKSAPEKKVLSFPGWRRWAALAACCAVVCLGIFGSGIWRGQSTPEAMADRPAATGAGLEVKMAEPEEAGEAAPPVEAAADSAPAVRSAAAAPAYDSSVQNAVPRQEPAAEKRTADTVEGRVLTAAGPAARAWAEETLGQAWEAGEVYELTEEQYLELTALLAEAGERFEESGAGAAGWFLRAEEPAR